MKTPIIIGLTGGIGTGKSTAAKILAAMDLPVHSADDAVHRVMSVGGAAVKPIARLFPEVLQKGFINRHVLGALVFGKPDSLKQLEDIVHPLVRKDERAFVRTAKRVGHQAVVLEIPLLFETGAEVRCDIVLCMKAPLALRRERVMKRKGMIAAKFNAIVKNQMPEKEKHARADYVISSAQGRAAVRRELKEILMFLGLPIANRNVPS